MGGGGEFGADEYRVWVCSIIPTLGAPPCPPHLEDEEMGCKQSEGLNVDTLFLNINLQHLQTKGASGV